MRRFRGVLLRIKRVSPSHPQVSPEQRVDNYLLQLVGYLSPPPIPKCLLLRRQTPLKRLLQQVGVPFNIALSCRA